MEKLSIQICALDRFELKEQVCTRVLCFALETPSPSKTKMPVLIKTNYKIKIIINRCKQSRYHVKLKICHPYTTDILRYMKVAKIQLTSSKALHKHSFSG